MVNHEKVYIVYEFIQYQGIDNVLNVLLDEEQAERAIEWYREEYKKEHGEYSNGRYRYMERELETIFNPKE